ncbi:hypothetical protein LTR56_021239 [Elasticomyces elasticus]|nr:hypothetical protein LTR56_021239 [Elasticomyces elasticus]KAK3663569.1 hypothetical protein LTR22_005509 [Elasticomyces elasticus]KAK4923561.1 hypothetical protein LTR49_009274 [Elasticomyces elasticus]KAK5751575.1 hypothetical protein LTS12_018348 [Elasticomyces elasticus]
MNARSLRRLATDHSALHNQPLPPNYLFPLSSANDDDLTQLDILLAGPSHTPFQGGLFKLHLTIPPTYPQTPPTAHFRTPIFHPNVEPQNGGVCVETLKRDWDVKLTLKDILVVISCLLIQPNPDSALNAEAGSLIQADYAAFSRRAELLTSIHATVPRELQEAVDEARQRGQIVEAEAEVEEKVEILDFAAPERRRRLGTARQRGTVARSSDGSPSGAPARRRQVQPLVLQSRSDDVFGQSMSDTNDSMQENDETKAASKSVTPRRMPLGDLSIEDVSSDDDMEVEYPPSPRKSPRKSPVKARQAESSRDAQRRAPNVTPPSNAFDQPLAEGSPFSAEPQTSPRKARVKRVMTPTKGVPSENRSEARVVKRRTPSAEKKREKDGLVDRLWGLCGQDIERWNRGDFDEMPFVKKAARW